MTAPGRRLIGLLAVVTVLAGTAAVAAAQSKAESCRDPYPCKQYWPANLNGPFALQGVRNVQMRSHDGTVLDGWIASPTVPKGVRTPVILMVSPYFDSVVPAVFYRNPSSEPLPVVGEMGSGPTGSGRGYWNDGPMSASHKFHSLGFPLIHLIRRGYTLAFFSVRGTGSSGGCFQFGGRDEQLDQVSLVNWVSKQPWSNGRVGMAGLSYMSSPAWQAAVQAPKALKTIVTAGDLTNLYEHMYSPQGSGGLGDEGFDGQYDLEMGTVTGTTSGRTQFLSRETCPHGNLAAVIATGRVTGDRDAAYWKERNLVARMPSVRAAVLNTEGYTVANGHYWQADAVWGSLARSTPKLRVAGYWGHEFPGPEDSVKTRFDLPSGTVAWESVVARWLDYWLKGIGSAPPPALVYHQDQALRWHEATSWPPRPRGKEVLYLVGGELAPHAQRSSTSFVSVGSPQDVAGNWDGGLEPALCPDQLNDATSRTYLTKPVSKPTLIAGSPMAYLRLASDRPDAVVTTSLFDIGPDFSCIGPTYTGAKWLGVGSADLSFYNSPFLAHPFPANKALPVRMDLTDVTYQLAPGHRLAMTLSNGKEFETGTLTAPTITVMGDSQLVVPVVEGTLGGKQPTTRYPQRPFTPRGYRE